MMAAAAVVRNANVPNKRNRPGYQRLRREANNEKGSWMRAANPSTNAGGARFWVTDLGKYNGFRLFLWCKKDDTLPTPDGDGPASSNSFAFDTKDRALSKPQSVDIKLAFGFAPSGRIPAF
jgi:hypothetical protein